MKIRALKKTARTILGALGCPDAELSILLTGDAQIAELNTMWRGKEGPTDVLSFSQIETPDGRQRLLQPQGYAGPLGDVVISVETAERQAHGAEASLDAELERLLVHGVLHLLGHDHVHGGRQAARMQAEEHRLLDAIRARSDAAGASSA